MSLVNYTGHQPMAYDVAGWNNPPPLVTYNPQCVQAAWCPLPRPASRIPAHPGPVMVTIPVPDAAQLGDDPTNPARQRVPRLTSLGMIGRLNPPSGGPS